MSGTLGASELVVVLLVALLGAGLVVIPACLICRKAGYIPWIGVLALVPLVNLVLFYFIALARWPVERELESLRSRTSGGM